MGNSFRQHVAHKIHTLLSVKGNVTFPHITRFLVSSSSSLALDLTAKWRTSSFVTIIANAVTIIIVQGRSFLIFIERIVQFRVVETRSFLEKYF